MDLKKQLSYWRNSSLDDLQTAELLIQNGRFLHGLFFCHLSLEKLLKAFIVRATKNFPPRIHNLNRLAELSEQEFTEEDYLLMDTLMIYQIEGRYPDYFPKITDYTFTTKLLDQTKQFITCLNQRL